MLVLVLVLVLVCESCFNFFYWPVRVASLCVVKMRSNLAKVDILCLAPVPSWSLSPPTSMSTAHDLALGWIITNQF